MRGNTMLRIMVMVPAPLTHLLLLLLCSFCRMPSGYAGDTYKAHLFLDYIPVLLLHVPSFSLSLLMLSSYYAAAVAALLILQDAVRLCW
jgi:hypothetical protein